MKKSEYFENLITTTTPRTTTTTTTTTFIAIGDPKKRKVYLHSTYMSAVVRILPWSSAVAVVCFRPVKSFGKSFGNVGWNLRKEAHAMASWTIPSCHRNAA